MSRDEVLTRVAVHREEIVALGVEELSLFGSFARGEGREHSDLDFIVQLRHNSFDSYMGVKELLETIFDRRVDLVLRDSIKPRLREAILREAVRAA
jgi:uncharacterized protein